MYPPLHVTNATSLSEKGLSYKNTMNMKTFSIYNNDEGNGFMLNVTDWCHFSSYWEGGVPAIRDIIMFLDMKARHKTSHVWRMYPNLC